MKDFQRLIRVLRKHCPLAFPITIRRVKMYDDGACHLLFNPRRFQIEIDRKLSEKMAEEVLLHEYAHALDWKHLYDNMTQENLDRECHGASWGVAYAQVYRVFEEHFLGYVPCAAPGPKK